MDLSGIEWNGFWTAAGALGSIAGAVIAYLTLFKWGNSKAVHDNVEEDMLINGSPKTRYNYYAEQLDQKIETIRLMRKFGIETLVIGVVLALALMAIQVAFDELEGFVRFIAYLFASGMVAMFALTMVHAVVWVMALRAGLRYGVLVATLGAELNDLESEENKKESEPESGPDS